MKVLLGQGGNFGISKGISLLFMIKRAFFKVNRNLNRRYDFAEVKGRNLVDFGIRFNIAP